MPKAHQVVRSPLGQKRSCSETCVCSAVAVVPEKLGRSWVKSTWRTQATNTALSSSKTYRVNTRATVDLYPDDSSYTVVAEQTNGQNNGYYNITFTKDTPAYRLTKFRAEFGDYAEVDSATFSYLFTEMFLMIDSRAKNMFVGFNGDPIE